MIFLINSVCKKILPYHLHPHLLRLLPLLICWLELSSIVVSYKGTVAHSNLPSPLLTTRWIQVNPRPVAPPLLL